MLSPKKLKNKPLDLILRAFAMFLFFGRFNKHRRSYKQCSYKNKKMWLKLALRLSLAMIAGY